MKTFTTLLVASALAASFAAPAFAGEEATLAERNVYTNPQPSRTPIYAMAPMKLKHANSGWSYWTKDQSIASQ
jgi:hypothetical protein